MVDTEYPIATFICLVGVVSTGILSLRQPLNQCVADVARCAGSSVEEMRAVKNGAGTRAPCGPRITIGRRDSGSGLRPHTDISPPSVMEHRLHHAASS